MNTPLLYSKQFEDAKIEIQQDEDSEEKEQFPSYLRSYSVPSKFEESDRQMKSKQILVRIMEMGMNVKLAANLLESISDEEFKSGSIVTIFNKVIDELLSFEVNIWPQKQQLPEEHRQQGYFYQIINSLVTPHLQKQKSQSQHQIECLICMSTIDDQEENNTLPCGHQFCRQCIKSHLKELITSNKCDKLMCPYDNCEYQIPDEEVQTLLGSEMYHRMQKFRKIKVLMKDPQMIWCPRIECESTIKLQGEKKKIVCQCGQEICVKCSRPYHPGQSCKQQIDHDFKQAVKDLSIQKCPKCRSHIQKSDGCNHMTCWKCDYQFCWLCRGKYSDKHYRSYNLLGCPDMQFSERDPFKYPNIYRFLIILAIVLLGPPLAIIVAGLAIVFGIILLPAITYFSWLGSENFLYNYNCFQRFLLILTLFILCIIFIPISAVLVALGLVAGVIVGIPYGIYLLIVWIKEY